MGFAIALGPDDTNTEFLTPYAWYYSNGNEYNRGLGTQVGSSGEVSITGDDFSFRTYVVPEPTSLALLGFGALLVARRRR